MIGTSIRRGEPVYVRAYSTQRAAVAELTALIEIEGRQWGQVRLVTEWYDWDQASAEAGPGPRVGELLQVEAYRLEAIRS